MITLIIDGRHLPLQSGIFWAIAIVSTLITVGFYLLRSFGLYAMAKKKEIERAWLVFIPCLWVYTACKIIGKTKFFGRNFEWFAILFCSVFALGSVLNFLYNFIEIFPIVGNFFAGREMFFVISTDVNVGVEVYTQGMTQISSYLYGYDVANPYLNMGISQQAINLTLSIIYYITSFTDIGILVITILIYVNLFRMYVPQHYILYAVLSVLLGIFAPLVFIIRKKTAVNYSEYLRSRYASWYANNSYYGGPVNNGAPKAPPTPFEEFAEKGEIDPGDPFENFSDKKDKDDNDEFFN